jgi:hypothetical protein
MNSYRLPRSLASSRVELCSMFSIRAVFGWLLPSLSILVASHTLRNDTAARLILPNNFHDRLIIWEIAYWDIAR